MKIAVVWDNYSIHKARMITKYLEKNRIKLVTIVSCSPFLNPWEHLIQGIKSKIKRDHKTGGKLS